MVFDEGSELDIWFIIGGLILAMFWWFYDKWWWKTLVARGRIELPTPCFSEMG